LTLHYGIAVAQADAFRDELQVARARYGRQQFEDQVRLEVADAYVAMQLRLGILRRPQVKAASFSNNPSSGRTGLFSRTGDELSS